VAASCDTLLMPPPAAPLRWGILGAGKIARDFSCAMLALEGTSVVSAVASRRPSARAEEFARQFGCTCHGSYEALVASDDVDVVYVATIHPTHYALAKLSLEAGKHVLVEKPFGMNAREARELAELALSRALFLMEAMWTACLPATLEALRMVEAGEIGELLSATASVGGVWYSDEELAVRAHHCAGCPYLAPRASGRVVAETPPVQRVPPYSRVMYPGARTRRGGSKRGRLGLGCCLTWGATRWQSRTCSTGGSGLRTRT
jgi:hypothetical protein